MMSDLAVHGLFSSLAVFCGRGEQRRQFREGVQRPLHDDTHINDHYSTSMDEL